MDKKAYYSNLPQELAQWAIAIVVGCVTYGAWLAAEKVLGVDIGYQNALGVWIVSWFFCIYLWRTVMRRADWGAIRKGAFYGVIGGIMYATVSNWILSMQ